MDRSQGKTLGLEDAAPQKERLSLFYSYMNFHSDDPTNMLYASASQRLLEDIQDPPVLRIPQPKN